MPRLQNALPSSILSPRSFANFRWRSLYSMAVLKSSRKSWVLPRMLYAFLSPDLSPKLSFFLLVLMLPAAYVAFLQVFYETNIIQLTSFPGFCLPSFRTNPVWGYSSESLRRWTSYRGRVNILSSLVQRQLLSMSDHLKYFRNIYCLVTIHSKAQDMRASQKTKTYYCWRLRFSFLTPDWLFSCDKITSQKCFFC